MFVRGVRLEQAVLDQLQRLGRGAAIRGSEAPALLINAGRGTQMVNYRVKGNYYVVDRLFSDAILVAGVGRDQDRVTISYAGATR